MTEPKPTYTITLNDNAPEPRIPSDNPHMHSRDDDLGVPFWKRPAITIGEHGRLMRDNQRMREALEVIAGERIPFDVQDLDTLTEYARRVLAEVRR